MDSIAIIIKTYKRDGFVQSLVETIDGFCDVPYRLYVADEQPISESKSRFYDHLISQGHKVIIFDEGAPVSVCFARNRLVQLLGAEKYVLRIDDDFHFCKETKISNLKKILDLRPEVGAVSDVEIQGVQGKGVGAGELSPKQGYFLFDQNQNKLIKESIPVHYWHWRTVDGVRYSYADFTRNFLLIRRSVFDLTQWDESLQIQGEHTDFMLALKKSGWLLAFTPDSVHIHNEPISTSVEVGYSRSRNASVGQNKMDALYKKKWGIDAIASLDMARVLRMSKRRSSIIRQIKKIFAKSA